MNSLKNIIAVYKLKASELIGVKSMGMGLISVPSLAWDRINIQTPARMSINTKVDGKNTLYTAQLTFRTCEELDDREHLVFMVQLANGKWMVLGTQKRPYCVVQVQQTMPDNMSDSQLNEVTVTLTSPQRIPYIAD